MPNQGSPGPAHVVAVANMKGGTGKTTLAVNLACALAGDGLAVALVDNDEQGSAAAWAAAGGLPVECRHLPLPPGDGRDLAGWVGTLAGLRRGRDVVVVDFPGGIAPALAATLLVASLVVVPCPPSAIEIAATRRMLLHVNRARAERPGAPPDVLVVPNRVQDMDGGIDDFRARMAALGEAVARPLRQRAQYDQAFARGLWVGAHRPGCPAHHEVLALASVVRERLRAHAPAPWPPVGADSRQTSSAEAPSVRVPARRDKELKVLYLDQDTGRRTREPPPRTAFAGWKALLFPSGARRQAPRLR